MSATSQVDETALQVLRANLEILSPEARARSTVIRADAWDPPVIPGPEGT